MAVKHASQYNKDGTTFGQDASDKCGFHGTAVVQASALATITTTTSAVAAINSIITALTNKGVFAA